MNSLRTRLILGTALVALVPLAIAIALLSQWTTDMVRREAAARVEASLHSLTVRLRQDKDGLDRRLALVSRDPTLRRLYLVQGAHSGELAEFLEGRRSLLGFDYLIVVDPHAPRRIGFVDGTPGDSSGVALVGSAAILYEGREEGTLEGGIRIDRDYLNRVGEASGAGLALTGPSGAPAASTDGADRAGAGSVIERHTVLAIGPPPHPTVTATIATVAADEAIRRFRIVAAVLALLGIALAVALASAWSAQVSRPVERIAAFSRRVARGEWSEPLELKSVRELETLATALDTMRTDLATYRDRLVTTERQAAWSLMARKIAHEVKNPLTPIAVSVADLKRSYEQGRADFPAVLDEAVRTISEEVSALKRILNEFSEFARLPAPVLRPFELTTLFADLRALYAGDITQGRLAIQSPGAAPTVSADGDQLRQAVINLVQNGLDASDGRDPVTLSAASRDGWAEIAVADRGHGLSAEQRAGLFTPGFTTKASGSGLGLTIAQRIVHDHRGTIVVESEPGRGTTMRIRLPLESSTARR